MLVKCVGFVCLVMLVAGVDAQGKRGEELEALIANSPAPVFTAKEYKRYIQTNPRPYIAIVFAAPIRNPQYQSLDEVMTNFKAVAHSYEAYRRSKRTNRQLAFVIYDTEEEAKDKLLLKHGLQSPIGLFLLPVTKEKGAIPTLTDGMMFDLRSGWATKDVHEWVVSRTRVNFPMYESPLLILVAYVGGLVAMALGMVGLVLLWRNRRGPFDRMFWFVMSSFLWGAVFGGTHYCILRDMPTYYFNPRTSSLIWFHPQANMQFLLEGYLMTAVQFTAGMLCVSLTLWYPSLKEGTFKRIAGYTLTTAFFASAVAVRKLYFAKQGW